MYKYVFLFFFICIITATEACSYHGGNVFSNRDITDSLIYYSNMKFENSSFKQDYHITLDSTLTSKAQRIHALRLVADIYMKEFKEDRDIPFTKLSLQALGDSLQILAVEELCLDDPDTKNDYYITYQVWPYFVNEKLSVYQIDHSSCWSRVHHNSNTSYYCFDKRSNAEILSNDFFDKTKDGLNLLIEKYLLLFFSGLSSEKITDINELKDLSFWVTETLHSFGDYAFSEKEMICTFNPYSLSPFDAGTITLRIPIEEAKPFLSDTLKELLF